MSSSPVPVSKPWSLLSWLRVKSDDAELRERIKRLKAARDFLVAQQHTAAEYEKLQRARGRLDHIDSIRADARLQLVSQLAAHHSQRAVDAIECQREVTQAETRLLRAHQEKLLLLAKDETEILKVRNALTAYRDLAQIDQETSKIRIEARKQQLLADYGAAGAAPAGPVTDKAGLIAWRDRLTAEREQMLIAGQDLTRISSQINLIDDLVRILT